MRPRGLRAMWNVREQASTREMMECAPHNKVACCKRNLHHPDDSTLIDKRQELPCAIV
jgi:hypothetical protein